jgi:hypothetical protein
LLSKAVQGTAIVSCRIADVVDYKRIGIRIEQRGDDRVVIIRACAKIKRGATLPSGEVDISTLLDQHADARLVAAIGRGMEGGTVFADLVEISTRLDNYEHARLVPLYARVLEGGNLCQIALRGTALVDPPVYISTSSASTSRTPARLPAAA